MNTACEIDNGSKLFYVQPNGIEQELAIELGYSVRIVELGGLCTWSNANNNAHFYNSQYSSQQEYAGYVTINGVGADLYRVATQRELETFLQNLRRNR